MTEQNPESVMTASLIQLRATLPAKDYAGYMDMFMSYEKLTTSDQNTTGNRTDCLIEQDNDLHWHLTQQSQINPTIRL